MKNSLAGAALTCLLGSAPVWAAPSPIFGTADVKVTSQAENKTVVGKGAYANLYGYYGNYYASYATLYGTLGYYYQNYSYYNSASSYAYDAYQYYYYASYYQQRGE